MKEVINLAEILDDTIIVFVWWYWVLFKGKLKNQRLKRQKRGNYYPIRSIKNEEWDKLKILKAEYFI